MLAINFRFWVLNDGGRIDVTTPKIRGAGSLGGMVSVYRTTRFLVHTYTRSDGIVGPRGLGIPGAL